MNFNSWCLYRSHFIPLNPGCICAVQFKFNKAMAQLATHESWRSFGTTHRFTLLWVAPPSKHRITLNQILVHYPICQPIKQQLQGTLQLLHSQLAKAHNRLKLYADQHRSEPWFRCLLRVRQEAQLLGIN
jgi:hypothetical protein